MNELKLFENKEFGKIQVINKNGEPWFVGKEVCELFGDTNYRRSISRLEDDEKGVSQIYTPGGRQNVTIVSEAGLYSLLFNMQPHKAKGVSQNDSLIEERVNKLKAFKRWITHDVIPAIRKHGGYLTNDKIEEVLTDPDTIIKLATTLKEERLKRAEAERQLEEAKPKMIFADAVSASDTTILIGDLAKLIKQNGHEIGQKRLFEWLRKNGYLIKRYGADYNSPTQRAMELGLFKIKETAITHSDGHVTVSKTVKVTGKGQQYFINKFAALSEGGAA